MSIEVKDAVQLNNSYKEYNKKAVQAAANSNSEQELNENLEKVGVFDFQQGGSYDEQLAKLALGQIKDCDKDGDGQISLEEYRNSGLEDYKGIIDDEKLRELAQSNDIAMEFYAMDYNIDDKVSMDELMLFYSVADESLGSEENQRIKDGKFSQEDLAQTQNTLLNMIMSENPKLEDELSDRLVGILRNSGSDIKRHDEVSEILKKYDDYEVKNPNSTASKNVHNSTIEESEFLTINIQNVTEENLAETKADSYSMFHLIDNSLGDSNGVIDETEINNYLDFAQEKGMSKEECYKYLLEKYYKSDDAQLHNNYEMVLQTFQE